MRSVSLTARHRPSGVDDADAAQLHKVADVLRRRTHKGAVGYPADFHRVVCDEPVATFDQLHGGLALADAALAEDEDALAVDLHEHTVAGDAGPELDIPEADERGHEQGGFGPWCATAGTPFFSAASIMLGNMSSPFVMISAGILRSSSAQVDPLPAQFLVEILEVGILHISGDLNAGRLKIFKIA